MEKPAISLSAKLKSSPWPVIASLEAKIVAAKNELDFYHKLLSWLLFSCLEEKRPVIEKLRAEVADFRNSGFSSLAEGVDRLKEEAKNEMSLLDLSSDIAHLLLYFNHLDVKFQMLKIQIQRRFGEFTHICIW